MKTAPAAVHLRDLAEGDLPAVRRIDALHTGQAKSAYWRRVFDRFVDSEAESRPIGLAAEVDGALAGYLLGEVRAFEFGSEPCGWIFAVGVEPELEGLGIATALLATATRRFRDRGIDTVRTMVRRNDVPVLSFFRRNGFTGGSFYQLEMTLVGEEST